MFYTGVTIVSFLGIDLLRKLIGLSLSGFTYTFNYMTSSKKYQDNIDIQNIELRLRLIENWLKNIDMDKIKQNNNLSLIYNSILDSCQTMTDYIEKVNEKIKYHHTKWFQSWRSLCLDDEIIFLDKNSKILYENISLFNLIY
jgi:hypothetical protein